MAYANTRRAIELAEKDYIPALISGGKVKGYAVYGKISDFVLRDVDIFPEKRRGGGFFAIFFPKVYQWLKEYPKENDVFNELSDFENPPYRVYSATGSVLVYIADENLRGADVYINLTKKTSLMRINEEHNSTAILTWEKRKGSNEWQIIPSSFKKTDINNLAKGLETYIKKGENDNIIYEEDALGRAYLASEWVLGTSVSSIDKRDEVDSYRNTSYEWKDTSFIDIAEKNNAEKIKELLRVEHYINRRTVKLGNFIGRLKTLLAERIENTRLDRISARLISEFSDCVIDSWDTRIGGEHKGFWYVDSFLDELSFAEPRYKTNIDNLRRRIYTGHKRDDAGLFLYFDGRTTENTTRVCQDKWFYTSYIIAKVAGVDFLRIKRNFDRCCNSFGIDSESCFYLLLLNPYLLALVGEGLRYEDCVAISAVIQSKDDDKPLLWSREDTKEMLYVLSIYRRYTQDSGYKDTLVTFNELLNKDTRLTNIQAEVITRPIAKYIWSESRSYYELNVLTHEVPKLFFKDFAIKGNPYKVKKKNPLETIIKKLCHIGLLCKVPNSDYYIPTYEACMELSFLKWIFDKNTLKDKILTNQEIEEEVQTWYGDDLKPADFQKYKTLAGLTSCKTALITANVFDNYNNGSNKMVDILDFLSHILTDKLGERVVWISDRHLKTQCKIEQRPRLPYIEPIYFCETASGMAVWKNYPQIDEPITYLLDNINSYSLWELYTFMASIKQQDNIIFIGDINRRVSVKGVNTLQTLSKIISHINLGVSKEVFECTGSARSEVPQYQQLIAESINSKNEKEKMFEKRVLKADDNVEIEGIIREIIDKSTGKIDKSEGNDRVVADTLSLSDIGLIAVDNTVDLDHFLSVTDNSLGYLNGKELYQGDRIIYTGISDLEFRRYDLENITDSRVILKTCNDTRGLNRKHELIALQLIKWKDIIIDNQGFQKPGAELALLCGAYDEGAGRDIYYLFDVKRKKNKEITGYQAKNLKKCHIYSFTNQPISQKAVQILLFNKEKNLNREDVYTAISNAYKRVYFVGSVNGRKSVLEIARETAEQRKGRTLIERIINEKRQEEEA